MFSKLYPFLLAALWVWGAACSGEKKGECSTNADCPSTHFRCQVDVQGYGACLCLDNEACAADEFCNPQGYCQKRQGCITDADCPANFRCQVDTSGRGTCLCTSDLACQQGQFCNSSGVCQEKAGCVLDADCGDPNAWFCRINPQTKIGECFCKSDTACEQGEFCNPKGYCQPEASCHSNEDCPAGKLCNTQTGECLCDPQTQSGCRSDEVCNNAGYCQPRPGCYDNSDCTNTPGTFCDLTSRTCIAIGTCTSDLQCPLGQICRQNACVAGCNYSYDCPLNQCCVNFQCQPCNCQTDEFCAFAEYCQGGNCQTAWSNKTPFCKPCNPQAGVWYQCGVQNDTSTAYNQCLIYPYEGDSYAGHSSDYCAVDCSQNDRCPNGFSCSEIIIVEGTCTSNAQCPRDVPCWKSPEEDKGYCPCHDTLNPCPEPGLLGGGDVCNTGGLYGSLSPPNTCVYQRKPCTSDNDCYIPCVDKDENGFGGCSIGKNCGLKEGIHCPYPWPGHYP